MKSERPKILPRGLKTDLLLMCMVISPSPLFLLSGRYSRGPSQGLGYKYQVGTEAHWKRGTADTHSKAPSFAGLPGQSRLVGFGLTALSALC